MPSRKRWMLLLAGIAMPVLIGGVAYWRAAQVAAPLDWAGPGNPAAALDELREGNARFVNSARTLSTDTAHDADNRRQTEKGQHPFAAILTCADSRVCPEFIFDQRAGSIFEVRNAGNLVDDDVLATFEYAVDHLHVPLMLVLGHKGCGAVHAVCEAGDKPLHDHLQELQKHMKGIQREVTGNHDKHGPDFVDRMCKENARQQALALFRDSQILKNAVSKGETRLMCGLYDMATGAVEFFEPE